MRCFKVIACLNAYADGELAEKQRRAVKAHLAGCEACRKQLANIRSLEGLLQDALHVPPVPDGLAAGVLQAARIKKGLEASPKTKPPFIAWNPFRWIAELSAPMRVATCVTVLLAMVVGWSLDGGWLAGRGMSNESEKNLYGVEWFDPAPPGSIGSIYMAMTTQAGAKGNGQ